MAKGQQPKKNITQTSDIFYLLLCLFGAFEEVVVDSLA